MRRFEVSLRRRTNLTILNDDIRVERAARYMSFLRDLEPTIDLEQTVLMDETAVYFEDARQTTLNFTGARHVVIRSNGLASMRITVVLRELLMKWIDRAFSRVVHGDGKCLVWVSMRAHILQIMKAKGSARKVAMCVVPGGIMLYLQAGGIGIYKSFKDLLYMWINTWKESDQAEYTRFGNPRMPSVDTVCEWVLRAWRDTEEATIMRSVKAAVFV
ncbi:hypothetical protein JG687_00019181 [Phytophthora cactorum]|uniref:DDE-1 domain-containing protein n=1 Tax=Phytophthora cactorum TaxID=29920 RepID=A0A8T1TMS5_9STRA|nr:hypothetical protein JG687_00019181 [Phytophthora cactorum]